MIPNTNKSKTFSYIGTALSISAYIILVGGAIVAISIPLFGFGIALAAVLFYLILITFAEFVRDYSLKLLGQQAYENPEIIKTRKRDRITRSILAVFLLVTFVLVYYFIHK